MKLTLFLTLIAVVTIASARMLRADPTARGETATVALINKALTEARPQATDERVATLRAAAKAVMEARPNNWLIATKLQSALDRPEASVNKQVNSLEAGLSEAAVILNFRMKKEADLPKGFPDPSALGEIQLKQYPAYRLARAPSQKDNAFFTLFRHIKANNIEMTAPVEMRYDEDDQKCQQVDMAFLYGAPDWGSLGDAGKGVIVEDIAEMTSVAIGLTGDIDPKASTYIKALETWLAEHASNYERDGRVRVMGYNSPFVWKSQRFYEIEIPVRKRVPVANVAKP